MNVRDVQHIQWKAPSSAQPGVGSDDNLAPQGNISYQCRSACRPSAHTFLTLDLGGWWGTVSDHFTNFSKLSSRHSHPVHVVIIPLCGSWTKRAGETRSNPDHFPFVTQVLLQFSCQHIIWGVNISANHRYSHVQNLPGHVQITCWLTYFQIRRYRGQTPMNIF